MIAKAKEICESDPELMESALRKGVADYSNLDVSAQIAVSESFRGLDMLVQTEAYLKRPPLYRLVHKFLNLYTKVNIYPASFLSEIVLGMVGFLPGLLLFIYAVVTGLQWSLAVYLVGWPLGIAYAASVTCAFGLCVKMNGPFDTEGFDAEGWTKRLREDDLRKVCEFFK
jgi:hypothetical protein